MARSASRLRTICYIDGFNLYYGLRDSGLRHCYWLNVRDMAVRLVRPPFVLAATKYFTARISGRHPDDSDEAAREREASRLRQQTFLEALNTLDALEILEGHFVLKRDYCRNCNRSFYRPEERTTDVRIATELMADAFLDRFESAMVVSGDSDLAPPINAIRDHFPEKRLVVAFPPGRSSAELRQAATAVVDVWPRTLERSQLPAEVVNHRGAILRRPVEWQ